MAKVKLTKAALKQQRDALTQYQRFLPTLQLKKQQLQSEMRLCLERITVNEEREAEAKQALSGWIRLFGDAAVTELVGKHLKVRAILTHNLNIAGIDVPVFESVDFEVTPYDLFSAEPWLDDAIAAVRSIVEIQSERQIIRRQYELIRQELRTTSQRVNLFEKVKIPEAKDNIRMIQISLSDSAIASVARSKIAKKKLQEEAA